METPIPTAEHRRLEKMAGKWEGEELAYDSSSDSKANVAIGRINSRIALGGFALIHDYERERNGKITFTGHGVFTYNSKEKVYELTWFDSMGERRTVFTGQFEGDVLRLTHGVPGMHARLTHDMSRPGHLLVSMEMAEDGANWTKVFDARLVRQ
jgi:hypothetical protein